MGLVLDVNPKMVHKKNRRITMADDKELFIAIVNCSGPSNIGQMSVEIAKKGDRTLAYANINCLPAIFPQLKPA